MDFLTHFWPFFVFFGAIFPPSLSLEQKCDADMLCGLLIERVYGAKVFFALLGGIFGPFGGNFSPFGDIFSVLFAIFGYLLTLE